MAIFQVIMRVLTALLSLYMVLITFRILLTWFQGPDLGRPMELLRAATDPYLRWFTRFQFLRIGAFDFSVVVALIVLSVLMSITGRLAAAGMVTVGLVLAIILLRVASAIGFFLILFLILALVRLMGSIARVNTAGRFWITVDRLLEPVVHKIVLTLSRGRFVTYQNALLMFSAVIAVTLFLGGFLVDALANLFSRMPF